MNRRKNHRAFVFFAAALLAGTAMAKSKPKAKAAPAEVVMAVPLSSTGQSKLWLEGNSTLHTFKANATQLNVDASLAGKPQATTLADLEKGSLQDRQFTLDVPVHSLKSGEGGLDNNMYKTLKAEKYPDIKFQISKLTVTPDEQGNQAKAKAEGVLTIAGVSRTAEVEGTVTERGAQLVVSGSKEVLMRDYGVEPPVMMFGAIKVDNKIKVGFELSLNPQTAYALKPGESVVSQAPSTAK